MNNFNTVILTSEARTATTNSGDITNSGHKGGHVIIDVTTLTGGASIVPTIQGKDPVSEKYYTLLVGAAIVGTGTTILRIYPGLTASANVIANDIIPFKYRVIMTAADSKSVTYSISINLI